MRSGTRQATCTAHPACAPSKPAQQHPASHLLSTRIPPSPRQPRPHGKCPSNAPPLTRGCRDAGMQGCRDERSRRGRLHESWQARKPPEARLQMFSQHGPRPHPLTRHGTTSIWVLDTMAIDHLSIHHHLSASGRVKARAISVSNTTPPSTVQHRSQMPWGVVVRPRRSSGRNTLSVAARQGPATGLLLY